jgi:hypothetical protein
MDLQERLTSLGSRETDGSRVLVTLLFTDLIGSTERAVALGDRRWQGLLGRHHGTVRALLDRFGGREVDTAGTASSRPSAGRMRWDAGSNSRGRCLGSTRRSCRGPPLGMTASARSTAVLRPRLGRQLRRGIDPLRLGPRGGGRRWIPTHGPTLSERDRRDATGQHDGCEDQHDRGPPPLRGQAWRWLRRGRVAQVGREPWAQPSVSDG